MAKETEINGYELSRDWFNFCFENTDIINPNHSALYFFCIEHCNRMGWKQKFGLPMEMAKDAIGIKNYRTYANTFNDLVSWGFIKIIQKSKNQYSANVIALVRNAKAQSKALSKAIQKHSQKQYTGIVGIVKPINLITKEHDNINIHFSENGLLENREEKKDEGGAKSFQTNYTEYPDHVLSGWPGFEKWLSENAPRVQQISKPLTIDSYCRNFEKYESDRGKKKLQAMQNKKSLLKDYHDANLTFLSWFANNLKEETKSHASHLASL